MGFLIGLGLGVGAGIWLDNIGLGVLLGVSLGFFLKILREQIYG